jgi:hypothetical protein
MGRAVHVVLNAEVRNMYSILEGKEKDNISFEIGTRR